MGNSILTYSGRGYGYAIEKATKPKHHQSQGRIVMSL